MFKVSANLSTFATLWDWAPAGLLTDWTTLSGILITIISAYSYSLADKTLAWLFSELHVSRALFSQLQRGGESSGSGSKTQTHAPKVKANTNSNKQTWSVHYHKAVIKVWCCAIEKLKVCSDYFESLGSVQALNPHIRACAQPVLSLGSEEQDSLHL